MNAYLYYILNFRKFSYIYSKIRSIQKCSPFAFQM